MNYTIFASSCDLERIIQADFLNSNELKIVEDVLTRLYNECDARDQLQASMTDAEWFEYESHHGYGPVPIPFFIFDNVKHKELIAYLNLADLGARLPLSELPDAFNRNDTINLLLEATA